MPKKKKSEGSLEFASNEEIIADLESLVNDEMRRYWREQKRKWRMKHPFS